MGGTLGALLFIAAAGGTAAYVASRPTHISGEVMAADLLPQLRATYDAQIETVTCEDPIRVLNTDTKFTCVATRADGTVLNLAYTMNRSGARHGAVTSVDDPEDRYLRIPPR
ncbi:MAG: hypothetical protein KF773_35385 [Deltaproteobacteria bacterium]|nr:hypothetical protein [Deltaproteobacteria bacterium]MCW5809055.1 hypothetical protein [Deltaproteobacteria bacterium]